MNDEIKFDTGAKELSDAAQSITEKIVSELKDAASRADAAEPRLFFPEGIELISVVVKVGPADVEVTIAGAKGIKSELTRDGKFGASLLVRLGPYHRDAAASDDSDPVQTGQEIKWYNDKQYDIQIDFGANNPLNVKSPFTVLGNGGEKKTYVTAKVANETAYPYKNTPIEADVTIVGMPRIIIQ